MLKTFFFLATLYTPDGPVVYVLDSGLSGADCIARMEAGILASDRAAVMSRTVEPAGEYHVPAAAFAPYWPAAVLSCEFEWGY